MEDNPIKIRKWLYPLSWIYGIGVEFRSWLFSTGILKSKSYPLPVICVGNITVGGTGKTPHIEYLVELLKSRYKVAVISRGYRRKSNGFVLADNKSTAYDIGDEPYQIKNKFPDIIVAVDENRCRGIERLLSSDNKPDVILLDDAFQHRYVKAGLNILLVNNNRLISEDALLPAGLLRESASERHRAGIVILTKCPDNMSPIDYRLRDRQMNLFPYQELFFSTYKYDVMFCLSDRSKVMALSDIGKDDSVLLLSGIADNSQMYSAIRKYTEKVKVLTYADHHRYTHDDLLKIENEFRQLHSDCNYIITTEKDASKLVLDEMWWKRFGKNIYVLPVRVSFMLDKKDKFDKMILDYVRENKTNF